MNLWRRHGLFVAVVTGYAAVVVPQLNHGLASADGHFVIATVRELADFHRVTFSRPPGHPTTEIFLYGGMGLVLRGVFHQPFTDSIYLWLQFLIGLTTAFVFYEWLARLGFSPRRAAVAVCCLLFSAQFLSNTMDGEEFAVAILFLVAALRLLTVGDGEIVSSSRIYISMFCFALAVGCRPELLLAGVIYPIYFYRLPQLGFKKYLQALPVQIGLLVLLWLPVWLSVGMVAPWGAGMNWKQAILGGGYKLMFQCFTLPVFGLFCWTLAGEVKLLKENWRGRSSTNLILITCWLIASMYGLLFFTYAAKPAYALVVVPFCVVLVSRRSPALLLSLAVCTVLGVFLEVDIFKNRRLTAPYVKPGAYFEITRQKPFYRLPYLIALSRQCGPNPAAIIAFVSVWDLEYHLARGTFRVERRTVENGQAGMPVFALPNSQCLLLTMEAAAKPALLQKLRDQGFSISMDRLLYRFLFEKYDFDAPDKNAASIAGVPVTLFSA